MQPSTAGTQPYSAAATQLDRAAGTPLDGALAAPPESAVGPAAPAARCVREASAPTDRASYACQCGYLFAAAVTTTVQCPHCGVAQAW